jgi:hypothetical protein
MATIRLRVTIGPGASASSSPYSRRISGQSRIGLGRDELSERGQRAFDHGDRDDPVEGDHRPGCQRLEQPVEQEDLRPVRVIRAGRFVMDGGDGRLELIWADRRVGQGRTDDGDPFGDRLAVPQAAILLRQRDERAVRASPGRPAGIGQQHQGEQTGDLAVVGYALVQLAGEADRFGRQLDAEERGP